MDHAFLVPSAGAPASPTGVLPTLNKFVTINGSTRRAPSATGSAHNSTKNKCTLVAVELSKITDPLITGTPPGPPPTTGGTLEKGATDVVVNPSVKIGGNNTPPSHITTARVLAPSLVPTDNTFHAVMTTLATGGPVVVSGTDLMLSHPGPSLGVIPGGNRILTGVLVNTIGTGAPRKVGHDAKNKDPPRTGTFPISVLTTLLHTHTRSAHGTQNISNNKEWQDNDPLHCLPPFRYPQPRYILCCP